MEDRLKQKGIRPTKIRKQIAAILFDGHDKHVTVDDVIDMVRQQRIRASTASIYNTLNRFAEAGLLRKVIAEPGKAFFDTNLSDHHHFFFEEESRLEDIPDGAIKVSKLPAMPKGRKLKSVSVMIRV